MQTGKDDLMRSTSTKAKIAADGHAALHGVAGVAKIFDWHRAVRRSPPSEMAAMIVSRRQGTPPGGCCERDAGRSPGSRVNTSGPVFPCPVGLSDPPCSKPEEGGRASGSPLTVAGAAAD